MTLRSLAAFAVVPLLAACTPEEAGPAAPLYLNDPALCAASGPERELADWAELRETEIFRHSAGCEILDPLSLTPGTTSVVEAICRDDIDAYSTTLMVQVHPDGTADVSPDLEGLPSRYYLCPTGLGHKPLDRGLTLRALGNS